MELDLKVHVHVCEAPDVVDRSGQHCRVSTAVLGFIFSNVTGLGQIMSVAVIYCHNKAM